MVKVVHRQPTVGRGSDVQVQRLWMLILLVLAGTSTATNNHKSQRGGTKRLITSISSFPVYSVTEDLLLPRSRLASASRWSRDEAVNLRSSSGGSKHGSAVALRQNDRKSQFPPPSVQGERDDDHEKSSGRYGTDEKAAVISSTSTWLHLDNRFVSFSNETRDRSPFAGFRRPLGAAPRKVIWSSGKVPIYYTKEEIFADMLPGPTNEVQAKEEAGTGEAKSNESTTLVAADDVAGVHHQQSVDEALVVTSIDLPEPVPTTTTPTMTTTGNAEDTSSQEEAALQEASGMTEYAEVMNSGIFKEQSFDAADDHESLAVRREPPLTRLINVTNEDDKLMFGERTNDSSAKEQLFNDTMRPVDGLREDKSKRNMSLILVKYKMTDGRTSSDSTGWQRLIQVTQAIKDDASSVTSQRSDSNRTPAGTKSTTGGERHSVSGLWQQQTQAVTDSSSRASLRSDWAITQAATRSTTEGTSSSSVAQRETPIARSNWNRSQTMAAITLAPIRRPTYVTRLLNKSSGASRTSQTTAAPGRGTQRTTTTSSTTALAPSTPPAVERSRYAMKSFTAKSGPKESNEMEKNDGSDRKNGATHPAEPSTSKRVWEKQEMTTAMKHSSWSSSTGGLTNSVNTTSTYDASKSSSQKVTASLGKSQTTEEGKNMSSVTRNAAFTNATQIATSERVKLVKKVGLSVEKNKTGNTTIAETAAASPLVTKGQSPDTDQVTAAKTGQTEGHSMATKSMPQRNGDSSLMEAHHESFASDRSGATPTFRGKQPPLTMTPDRTLHELPQGQRVTSNVTESAKNQRPAASTFTSQMTNVLDSHNSLVAAQARNTGKAGKGNELSRKSTDFSSPSAVVKTVLPLPPPDYKNNTASWEQSRIFGLRLKTRRPVDWNRFLNGFGTRSNKAKPLKTTTTTTRQNDTNDARKSATLQVVSSTQASSTTSRTTGTTASVAKNELHRRQTGSTQDLLSRWSTTMLHLQTVVKKTDSTNGVSTRHGQRHVTEPSSSSAPRSTTDFSPRHQVITVELVKKQISKIGRKEEMTVYNKKLLNPCAGERHPISKMLPVFRKTGIYDEYLAHRCDTDYHGNCNKSWHDCAQNESHIFCPKTCRDPMCGNLRFYGTFKHDDFKYQIKCRNSQAYNCDILQQRGDCLSNAVSMASICPESCGYCQTDADYLPFMPEQQKILMWLTFYDGGKYAAYAKYMWDRIAAIHHNALYLKC